MACKITGGFEQGGRRNRGQGPAPGGHRESVQEENQMKSGDQQTACQHGCRRPECGEMVRMGGSHDAGAGRMMNAEGTRKAQENRE